MSLTVELGGYVNNRLWGALVKRLQQTPADLFWNAIRPWLLQHEARCFIFYHPDSSVSPWLYRFYFLLWPLTADLVEG